LLKANLTKIENEKEDLKGISNKLEVRVKETSSELLKK